MLVGDKSGGAPDAHAASHVDGTDDIQDATALKKGLATAAHITQLTGAFAADGSVNLTGSIVYDAPTLGIKDLNSKWLILFGAAGSAVNYFKFLNAPIGFPPGIYAQGDDDHISVYFAPKGDGVFRVGGSAPGIKAENLIDDDLDLALSGNGTGVVTANGSAVVRVADSIGAVADVDMTTNPPETNQVQKWNGLNWVPGTAGDTNEFTFSIDSFTDNESSTQLIGSGVWEAAGAITFDVAYLNGPPSAATVTMSTNGGGGVWGTNPLVMDSPFATKVTAHDTNYPTSKDTYITFTLNTTPSDSDTETVYFRNKIIWGSHATGTGLSEAQVEALTGGSEAISNDTTRTMALSSVSTNYLVFAHPASYTSIKTGDDYEDDGHTGFLYNGIACAMELDDAALSITNSAGFTEDYKVYISKLASLGDHSLVSSSGNATIDPLYYGKTVKTDTFLEADIEGLATDEVTNDNTQVWDAVTTGSGEYMLFAFPKRLGIPTFWVGGFEGGFEAPETVSVTNANGFTEDYYAWRSTNSNLGATVVETK